jgi:hypothetical protein
MAGISGKNSFKQYYEFFPGKMDSILIEKIREIQYMPRHLENDPKKFIDQCVENTKTVKTLSELGSPIIDDYLKNATYEKNYINIFSSFIKNTGDSFYEKVFNVKEPQLFNDLFNVLNTKSFYIKDIYKFTGRDPIEDIEICSPSHLMQSIESILSSFRTQFADVADKRREFGYRDGIPVFCAEGLLDLQLVCCEELILKDVEVATDMLYTPRLWGDAFKDSNLSTSMRFSKPNTRRVSNLLYHPNIQKQVLKYLL